MKRRIVENSFRNRRMMKENVKYDTVIDVDNPIFDKVLLQMNIRLGMKQ